MDNKQYYIDILSSMADRTIKRLWIVIILLLVMLFGSNAAWVYYESQWAVVESSVTQEAVADGDNDLRLVGGDYYAARAKQTVKTKSRTRKTGGNSGYVKCNMCHGTGRVKNWRKK